TPAAKEASKSACATAADHLANEFIATEVKHVSEADRPTLVRILTERCAKMFSEEQLHAVEGQLDRELPDGANESEDTESAPPPPAPPDDPCGGGA
ncbi:MAG TPA: hypothetical protein VM261_35730, partial [Kofleriaceae bacterium]|nr:hypothetical protein [Kofleriaceae bacterium]